MRSFGIPFASTFTEGRFFPLAGVMDGVLPFARPSSIHGRGRKGGYSYLGDLGPKSHHIQIVCIFPVPGRTWLAVAGGHPGAWLCGGVAHVGVDLGARPVVPADGVHHHVAPAARRGAPAEGWRIKQNNSTQYD